MVKKTRKGGTSILEKVGFENINKKGFYIADDIDYNIRQGKKKELIKKYEDNLNEAKRNVIKAKEEKDRNEHDEELKIQKEKNSIELKKHRAQQFQFFLASLGNFMYKLYIIISGIISKIWDVLKSIFTGIKNAAGVGQGVIIKTIILILLIIVIFFVVNFAVYGDKAVDNIKNTGNKLVSTDKDYSGFLIKNSTPDFMSNISNSFYNLVPDNYKLQFNFFKNKFNSVIGNDIYSIVGSEREIITTGRNDGIYHIKKNNDSDNTYTTLKPKDITIPMSSIQQISNIDYHKLPENIKNIYPINDKSIVIPVELNNNKWIYNIEKIKYEGDNANIKDKYPTYISPFLKTSNDNEFKFNKFEARIYNDNDKSASAMINKFFKYDTNYKYPF